MLITNLFFAIVANLEADISLLSLIVGLDSFAAGLVGTINIAFLTSLVSKKYTAVQYAMLTSFMMLPGKFFSGFSGILADYYVSISSLQTGWAYFFLHYISHVHSSIIADSNLSEDLCSSQ